MIRNEIGLYNRWGRFAFRWRSYRGMHHWIDVLREQGCWNGYHDLKIFDKFCEVNYGWNVFCKA